MKAENLGLQFSCPAPSQHDERRTNTNRLLNKYIQDHLFGFLKRRGPSLLEHSDGLVPMLRRFAEEKSCGASDLRFPVWPLAKSLEPSKTDKRDHTHTAALAAAHLTATDSSASWSARLQRPNSLRFGVHKTPDLSLIEVRQGQIKNAAQPLIKLPTATIDEQRALLLVGESEAPIFELDREKRFSNAASETHLENLQDAIALTRAYAPEYLPWYGDVVGTVAALAPTAHGTVQSGSRSGQPGIIYASFPIPAIRLAETLIHEASHQYFHLAETETRLSSSKDERHYWSPYPQKNRPIGRILLAFHAFANVAIFYQRVLERSGDAAHKEIAETAIERHLPILETYSKHLRKSAGLTGSGRAMYEPLAARLSI